jgi:hypothetical protein
MSQVVCLYWNEAAQIPELGQKNTCGSGFPTNPNFFCQRYYFFDAAKGAALFSPGGCAKWAAHTVQHAKMASVVTIIIIIELCTHNMNNIWLEKGFLHQCLCV